MTNDELLAGFLDRSLSEDQLLEFEHRRESDAEFSQQASSMLRVEKVIPMAAPVIALPTDFLQAVEADVATKVASASTGSFFSGIAQSAWTWVAGAGAVAITAGSVYMATQSSEPAAVAVVQQPAVQEQAAPAEVQELPIVKAPVRENAVVSSAPVQRQRVATAQRITADQSTAPVRQLAPAPNVDIQTESADPALESLLADLEACRGSGDHVRCAQIGLAVGRTYRERGDRMQAERYLGQALVDARDSRTVQYEVNILGELAINAQQAGRNTDALEYLYKAISIGERVGLDVSQWKTLLDSQE